MKRFLSNLVASFRTPNKACRIRPALEVEFLERRDLMSFTAVALPNPVGTALISSLRDPTIRAAALTDYNRDGQITRNDMIDIIKQGTSQYTFTSAVQYQDLLTLVRGAGAVGMPGYVQQLAANVLENGPAFSIFQSGNMSSGSYWWGYDSAAASDLGGAVGNWFLGQVHPYATSTTMMPIGYGLSIPVQLPASYQVNNLPLFLPTGQSGFLSVNQGQLGDCWLMATMAEVDERAPAMIHDMFIDNGDGTFTVRFFVNDGATPQYVTVDRYLPTGANGGSYATPYNELWPALIEKAYAQLNAGGTVDVGLGSGSLNASVTGVDSYLSLNGGQPSWALSAITGQRSTLNAITDVPSAWSQGQFVVLSTGASPSLSQLVPNHSYSLQTVSGATYILYNPWGQNSTASHPEEINVSLSVLEANFITSPQSVSAPAALSPCGKLDTLWNADEAMLSSLDMSCHHRSAWTE